MIPSADDMKLTVCPLRISVKVDANEVYDGLANPGTA